MRCEEHLERKDRKKILNLQHLAEDLHVEITAFAPPAEAHARIAYALTEVMMLAMYSDQTHVGVPNSDSGGAYDYVLWPR